MEAVSMGILDNETKAESIYRQTILDKQVKKTIPIALILLIILVGLLLFIYTSSGNVIKHGLGNPYECMDCDKLGFACKEHREFDARDAIKDKVDRFALYYIPSESNVKYILYGIGNEYNTKCDFCNKEETECYGCEYNRLAILDANKRVYEDGVLSSRLCSDCWKLGYANCNTDRVIMGQMMYRYLVEEG